jgi:uncharacterized protein
MTRKTDRFNDNGHTGKPYNSFSDYLWKKYSCRVLKIPINAGLSCPNRGGPTGGSGCVFCSEDGSATPGMSETMPIPEQMARARENFKRADPSTRYIAYFQAYTNTHAPVPRLKNLYDLAVGQAGITGLMIGTRPDCLPDPVLDLVASYGRPGFELWLEVGMQTCHDKSLALLRRGHTHDDTISAVTRAAARGIPVCVHLILGIPGESWNDMMETALSLRGIPVSGIKFHHLHVIRGTALEEWYRDGRMKPLSQEEYVSTLCDFIERVQPGMLIHRFMGDREESTLIAPRWGLFKGTVHKAIDDEFRRRGTFQGFLIDRQGA